MLVVYTGIVYYYTFIYTPSGTSVRHLYYIEYSYSNNSNILFIHIINNPIQPTYKSTSAEKLTPSPQHFDNST